MADLVTLAGDYNYNFNVTHSRLNRRSRVKRRNEELMGDLFDFFKSATKFVVSPFVSVGKGIGHAGMEMYRGIKSGDIKKILAAPFRGIGHTGGTFYRTSKSHLEYYWRPSKMKDWMRPIGAAITAIGAVPGPHTLIMVPLGLALTLGGTIGEGVYIKDQMKKAEDAAKISALEKQEKANLIWTGVAGVGVVAAYMLLS